MYNIFYITYSMLICTISCGSGPLIPIITDPFRQTLVSPFFRAKNDSNNDITRLI